MTSDRASITIGELRHRFSLMQAVTTSDGAGGRTVTWSLMGEAWGALRPRQGFITAAADGAEGRVTHEIWVRHRSDLTRDIRFRLGTREFEIRAIIDVGERHRFLCCEVEERVP